MKDLDKLLKGEQIYRHEDLRSEANKWEGWAELFQFGTLGLLFMSIFILKSLPHRQAKVVVWYIAGVLFVTATIGLILGHKAANKTSKYLKSESNRVGKLLDDSIEKVKK